MLTDYHLNGGKKAGNSEHGVNSMRAYLRELYMSAHTQDLRDTSSPTYLTYLTAEGRLICPRDDYDMNRNEICLGVLLGIFICTLQQIN